MKIEEIFFQVSYFHCTWHYPGMCIFIHTYVKEVWSESVEVFRLSIFGMILTMCENNSSQNLNFPSGSRSATINNNPIMGNSLSRVHFFFLLVQLRASSCGLSPAPSCPCSASRWWTSSSGQGHGGNPKWAEPDPTHFYCLIWMVIISLLYSACSYQFKYSIRFPVNHKYLCIVYISYLWMIPKHTLIISVSLYIYLPNSLLFFFFF